MTIQIDGDVIIVKLYVAGRVLYTYYLGKDTLILCSLQLQQLEKLTE